MIGLATAVGFAVVAMAAAFDNEGSKSSISAKLAEREEQRNYREVMKKLSKY